MNPPVNVMSRGLAEALREAWFEAESDETVTRIVITGSGTMFVAGADLREIERITRSEIPPDLSYLNELLNGIERGRTLVVMALNGGALGIGLELAMAGHYRVLRAGTSVGLPEVTLGLIPGAGGTQRLPRLAGVGPALRMCLTGNPVSAEEALQLGIVDRVVEDNVVAAALEVSAGRKTNELPCKGNTRIVEALLAAVKSKDFEEGLEQEALLFREALEDPEAKAKVAEFFAARRRA